jgi:hypothetical protein
MPALGTRAGAVVGAVIILGVAGAVFGSKTPAARGAFVRIDTTQCSSGSRRGSGFVWTNTSSVVTALHVVASCANIAIRYPVQGGQSRNARIERVLRKYDLALLTVENPLQVTPLQTALLPPAANAPITVWGYPSVVRTLLDTQVRRRATQGSLADLLNQKVRQEILSAGMPDLNAEVMLVDGHLLPGHSGAPIIDSMDRVVAIADGGLEQGAAEVNWGIPAGRLAELSTSPEKSILNGAAIATLFAAENVTDEETNSFEAAVTSKADSTPIVTRTSFKCGSGTLVKMRTRSFAEVAPSADDQLGLMQLVNASGGFIQAQDRFDIYQELKTGATLVVPEGATISEAAGLCVSVRKFPDVRQVVKIAAAANTFAVQQEAVSYEQQVGQLVGPQGWQPDPAWTYLAPLVRLDGFSATRRGNVQYSVTQLGVMVSGYAFETLVTKGGLFMGVTGVRTGVTPAVYQRQQQCVLTLFLGSACAMVRDELHEIALTSVATHLSTFPIG